MSGIVAVVTFDGSPSSLETLASMADATPYRRTHAFAGWAAEGAALASMRGRPPRSDRIDAGPIERHGLVVAADARLDDRDRLADTLRSQGFLAGDARESSDAELIVAAHRCWGDAAPDQLVGDFAYVLWDTRRRRLAAVRDPMGMRPLYHRIEAGRRALLASEIQQLLAAPNVPCAINERGLVATLAGPYLPADATVYEGIGQVPPGQLVVVDAAGTRVRRWWSPDPAHTTRVDDETAVAMYREHLAQAVEDRMRGGGIAGLLLSGGMDSGSIAATAGWLGQQGRQDGAALRTYSWAFPSLPDADERDVAALITDAYGLPAIAVEGDDAWPLSGSPDDGPDRDDPFIWPYQRLHARSAARAAADGATVLLSGSRGDELVGDWVFDELGLLRRGRVGAAAIHLRHAARVERRAPGAVLRRHVLRPWLWDLGTAATPLLALRDSWTSSGPAWAPWIPDDVARRVDLADMVRDATEPPRFDGYARSLRLGRLTMGQGMRLATLGERTQANAGLAHADPFSDRRLVEFVLSLPAWQVQDRTRPKHLAREAMRGVMPEPARATAGKTIPASLFDRGLRDRGIATARDLLVHSRAAQQSWLDADAALAALDQYVRTGVSRYDIWWPLTVEWWLRRWWP